MAQPTQCRKRGSTVRKRGGLRFCLGTVLAVAGILGILSAISAQQITFDRNGAFQFDSEEYDLHSDRTLSRGIERARASIAKGEYSPAIRFLDQVLADDRDCFVEMEEDGRFAGLKKTANELIRQLPPEGRSLYDSLYSGIAAKKLTGAISAGQWEAVREIARRYFHTPAGYQATLLIAKNLSDQGHFSEADQRYRQLLATTEARQQLEPELSLLCSQNLLAAGSDASAEQLLSKLGEPATGNSPTLRIAGEKQILREGSLNWFKRQIGNWDSVPPRLIDPWLVRGGNAARNGHAGGGLPHMRVRWQARLLNHPQLETVYHDCLSGRQDQGQPLLSASTTLAVGDTIITTTPHNVVAVDLHSGKRLWQTQPQHLAEFDPLLGSDDSGENQDINLQPAKSFESRIWDDHQYNAVSSDGERVFVLRDLTFSPLSQDEMLRRLGGWPNGIGEINQPTSNRLCAYDLQTQGKLLWEIDGAVETGELAESFFLGAPLPVDNSLYSLVEIKSSIHLARIDAASGKLLEVQQLADLHSSAMLDQRRRLQAVTPSYASGVLVCPTGAGVVIGFDVQSQSIAWYYPYENLDPTYIHSRRSDRSRRRKQPGEWLDSTAVIAEDRVLITPPESDRLHCLDLFTGKLLWPLERDDALFLAGVDHGRVLIVGKHAVSLYTLEDGQPLWDGRKLALPPGTTPTGRGFFSEGHYYLPLSDAEVISIDLERGKIVNKAFASTHQAAGNLIAHRGTILSNNGIYLDCFDQIEVLKKRTEELLAKDPQNDVALRTLGEIAYNEGRLHDAVEVLEKSYRVNPKDSRTREVLADCLLEALGEDFAAYRDRLEMMRDLIADSPAKLTRLRRLEAEGMLAMDQVWPAFTTCVEVFQSSSDLEKLEQITLDYSVSTNSWLRALVTALWNQADRDTKERIVARLEELRAGLPASSNTDSLSSFVRSFGVIPPIAEKYDLEVARAYRAASKPLFAQQWHLDAALAKDHPAHAEAVASCFTDAWQKGFGNQLRSWQEELSSPLADEVCLERKTGSEVLGELGIADDSLTPDWPYGKTETQIASTGNAEAARKRQLPFAFAKLERSDSLLERCSLFLSTRDGISVRDRFGQEVFQYTASDDRGPKITSLQDVFGIARGNLLVISSGNRLTAIDTLAGPNGGSECQLWSKNLWSRTGERAFFPQSNRIPTLERASSFRNSRAKYDDKWIAVLGPLTRENCIYQDQKGLHSVDPLSGNIRWSRTDAPNACELYGDEKLIIAVSDIGTTAHLYQTQDGRDLGEIEIPEWTTHICSRGSDLVVWRKQADQRELATIALPSGEIKWSRSFAEGSKLDVALNRYVAVVEPDGTYVLLDLDHHEEVIRYKSPNSGPPREVFLLAGSDQIVIAVNKPLSSTSQKPRQWSQGLDTVPFSGELMAFELASGKPLWQRPAEIPQQMFIKSQPVDLPLVFFSGNYKQQDHSGTSPASWVTVLDKRSGQILFDDDSLQASGPYHSMWFDREKNEATLDLQQQSISFQLTNVPRPPAPPAVAEAVGTDTKGPQGIYRIMQQFWGNP